MSRTARVALTPSGTATAIGACAVAVIGMVTGYREFVALAVTALVVVVLATLVPRTTSPISVRRHDLPRFVERGSTLAVTLVATSERGAPGTQLFEQMGGVTIPVDLPRVAVGRPTVVVYRVRALRRGVQHLGPILEERTDPIGLATRTIRHDVVDEVVVHPVIHRLPLPESAARAREALEALARLSEDPVSEFRSLREYVPGDDQRRIHWMSTAKTGTVLVRDTFEFRRATKGILLETLETTTTDQLFEDAVEIAASLTNEAFRRQVTVVARTRDAAQPGHARPIRHREDILELFGRVSRTTAAQTLTTARTLGGGEPPDQLIVVGAAGSPLIAQLCASRSIAHRLLVVRLVDGSFPVGRLPVRSVDVSSVEEFLFRWRRGEVPA